MVNMAIRPPQTHIRRLEPFRGLNLSVTPTQIDEHQSPDLLNVQSDERGALNKRTGYERMYAESLGDGAITGMFEFKGDILFTHNGKLYKTEGIPSLANNTRPQTWEDDNLTESWEVES
jgi:hypothetical protein